MSARARALTVSTAVALVLLILSGATAVAKPALRGGVGARADQVPVLRNEVVTGATDLWVAGVRRARYASVSVRRAGAKRAAAKKRLRLRKGALAPWALDSTKLADGSYVARATVARRGGRAILLTARFRISNHGARSDQLIASALAHHKIDLGTSLVDRFYAFLGDARLPASLHGAPSADDAVAMDARAALTSRRVRGREAKKLARFLLRPTDPRSPLYSGPAARAAARASAAKAACGPNQWAPKVGTGDRRLWAWQDKDQTAFPGVYRWVQALASTDLAREEKDMGPTASDAPFDCARANPSSAVDVYLVNGPAATVSRSTESTGASAYAVTVPLTCAKGTCSSFVLVNLQLTGLRRSFVDTILTHELYHVLQMARMSKWLPQWPWLTEAGATWAMGHYEPGNPDAAAYSNEWYAAYQEDTPALGFGSPCKLCQYRWWIWPFFMTQEGASVAKAWKVVADASSDEDVNRRLDAYFPYASHLRDFVVRDFNVPYHERGGAAGRRFQTGSGAWPAIGELGTRRGLPTTVLTNTNGSPQPVSSGRPHNLDFFFQEFKLPDKDHLRRVKFDFAGLGPDTAVDLLVHVVGQSELEHRRLSGKDFEFCRDDPGDDIDHIYAFYSNSKLATSLSAKATTTYRGYTSCQPVVEWSGPFTATDTSSESTTTISGNADFVLDPNRSTSHNWQYYITPGSAIHVTYSGSSPGCTTQGSGTVTADAYSRIEVQDPHTTTAFYGVNVGSQDTIPVTDTCTSESGVVFTKTYDHGVTAEVASGPKPFNLKLTELQGSFDSGPGPSRQTSSWSFGGVKLGDAP